MTDINLEQLEKECEAMLKEAIICKVYGGCKIQPRECAKRYHSANEGTDVNNIHEIDFQLCLTCETGLMAYKTYGVEEAPAVVYFTNRQKQQHKWATGGTVNIKLKKCVDCGHDFRPTGPASKRCAACKELKATLKKSPEPLESKPMVVEQSPEPLPDLSKSYQPCLKNDPIGCLLECSMLVDGLLQNVSEGKTPDLHTVLEVRHRLAVLVPENTVR